MGKKNPRDLNIPCLGLPLNRDIKMTLTFPEPQRPGKTWDLHVIVQACWRRAGRDSFSRVGSWSSRVHISEHPPLSPPRGCAEGEVVAGAVCSSCLLIHGVDWVLIKEAVGLSVSVTERDSCVLPWRCHCLPQAEEQAVGPCPIPELQRAGLASPSASGHDKSSTLGLGGSSHPVLVTPLHKALCPSL